MNKFERKNRLIIAFITRHIHNRFSLRLWIHLEFPYRHGIQIMLHWYITHKSFLSSFIELYFPLLLEIHKKNIKQDILMNFIPVIFCLWVQKAWWVDMAVDDSHATLHFELLRESKDNHQPNTGNHRRVFFYLEVHWDAPSK